MRGHTFSIAFRVWRWGGGIQTARPWVGVERLPSWLTGPSLGLHIGWFKKDGEDPEP
jgi:hypothetical protein